MSTSSANLVPSASPASLVTAAHTLPPQALQRYRREVERFVASSPGNVWGELARCAVYSRLGDRQAADACDAAAAAAQTDELRRLVSSAREPLRG